MFFQVSFFRAGIKTNSKICSRLMWAVCVSVLLAVTWTGAVYANEALWSRGLHFQTEGEVVPLAEDGIHDPTNQAVVEVLQEPVESMADFPRDGKGIIDWVKVLDQGLIEPRESLYGDKKMHLVDFDIIFTNTGSMPHVRFPHLPHTQWLSCSNCHPAIFLPQKGGNPITMAEIIEGEYCGVCHGKVAFPPTMNCGRCHSVPRKSPGLR
ncbi:probable cytochrome c5 [hydrothermal vent metagenome]|uniref:Probable cytochrome c5 n=1 Tax=hydrothermal vent metagenome TaxID=652676 RepID=A0A3B0Z4H8_9ZZZZ